MSTHPTVSPKTARGAATRARIVDAATGLVRAHGAANTTIDAVIEASKVSKSQIYHYFTDKDDLVFFYQSKALMEERIGLIHRAIAVEVCGHERQQNRAASTATPRAAASRRSRNRADSRDQLQRAGGGD